MMYNKTMKVSIQSQLVKGRESFKVIVKTQVIPGYYTGVPHRFKCGYTFRLTYTIQARWANHSNITYPYYPSRAM